MTLILRRSHVLLAVAVAWAPGVQVAQAQIGASPNPSGPTTSVGIPQEGLSSPFFTGRPTFVWGDTTPNDAIPISYDPSQGPIDKTLTFVRDQNEDGNVDLNDFNYIFSGPTDLREALLIGPGPDWTDWHETILTPNWAWANPSLTPINASANVTVQQAGQNVDFFFDPLPPGTIVGVDKQLVFTGDLNDPQVSGPLLNDFFAGTLTIQIREYPTIIPEPAGGALCGVALFAVARRRRRTT